MGDRLRNCLRLREMETREMGQGSTLETASVRDADVGTCMLDEMGWIERLMVRRNGGDGNV